MTQLSNPAHMPLRDKAAGCLAGAACGDALGGATEGFSTEQIRQRYGGWVEGIVPPYHANWREAYPLGPYHRGDGHVTDDTLMTQSLVQVYLDKKDHLDAYDIESRLVPKLMEEPVWVPELETQTIPLLRLFLAEKWLALRLHYGNVDPRDAGNGNMVNCGAAMYMAPVGIVNACRPASAYREALDLAAPHQSSYGREAAAVFAAAVAAAMTPRATPRDVVDVCVELAHDGTQAAIKQVSAEASRHEHWSEALPALRAAVTPFDLVGPAYRAPGPMARRPSRVHAIEELPLALAFLLIADGDYRDCVLGGVNYGRDADSIATMGGALAGALNGLANIPPEWHANVSEASRQDFVGPAVALADLAAELFVRDEATRQAEGLAFSALIAGDAVIGAPDPSAGAVGAVATSSDGGSRQPRRHERRP